MRVLVTIASDGSTDAIGARIGSVLRARGHQVDVRTPGEVITVDSYDVVVLGSALDEGHWRDDARGLVVREVADLSARPVWLFSEATDVATHDEIIDVTDVMRATHAYEHRVFVASDGSGSDGGTMTAVLVPEDEGDPWDDVDRWATSIADSISSG
jgi:menaquinone-dependent protoporphyrinogen oxidase